MITKIKSKIGNILLHRLRVIYVYFTKDENNPLRKGPKGNFIFIHINKTAGSSIKTAIGLTKKNHLTVKEIIDTHGVGQIVFKNTYKFAVVRNPWDRALSQYKYRVKTNQCNMKDEPIPFKDWVKKTYGKEKDSFYYSNPKMFLPQVDWLKDYNGEIRINKILRFENLNEEFSAVLKDIGIEKQLPHYNKTKRVDYREYYNEETKLIIEDWFKEDIEQFGYSF